MPDSAHGVPSLGVLAQLNSHFDVGMIKSWTSAGPKYGQVQYDYPREGFTWQWVLDSSSSSSSSSSSNSSSSSSSRLERGIEL